MLELIEKYNGLISNAYSEAAIVDVLRALCDEFGFRSAVLIDYMSISDRTMSVLDTQNDRLDWWQENFLTPERGISPAGAALLAQGGVIRFDAVAMLPPDHDLLHGMQQLDLTQAIFVPIKYDQDFAGMVGYVGWPELLPEREIVLQFLTYNLLTQKLALYAQASGRKVKSLTPREQEVITLAAKGETSKEIAESLGMSARTVNQHLENVGKKLGTQNRTHTIAESIRQKLLG